MRTEDCKISMSGSLCVISLWEKVERLLTLTIGLCAVDRYSETRTPQLVEASGFKR